MKRLVEEVGRIEGVLVGGDVAYRGAAEEYATASTWLSEISAICGFSMSSVWVVPGNHDIDRSVVVNSPTLQWYRSRLRQCAIDEIDEQLEEILLRDPSGRTMFDPLVNYNAFADPLGCAVTAESPFWQTVFELPDDKRLLVRGVSSPLVSDSTDSDVEDRSKLVLGGIQALVPREAGRASVVMCHHPPSWLRDGGQATRRFQQRTQLQLYGHLHTPAIDPRARSLAITAGALHPERGPGWEPRYNLIRLAIDGEGVDAELLVEVYARVWSEAYETFVADLGETGNSVREFRLPLNVPAGLEPAVDLHPEQTESVQIAAGEGGEPGVVSPMRELLYRFATLPYARRLAIAEDLSLIEESDRHADEIELHRAIFVRARERGQLAQLWDAVSAERQDDMRNPFRS